ncbi:lipopolysaccharide biosynthesis protein [Methylobacterium planeticum]|uniref:Oligosaccharide flippase family protein n=1 Tax=Methylobacterium planeticum TaxID=2615211 RepID=A0A6N6MPP0_9HYPH|nr:oligosaccharide flippase family protein [Methylobacterium planeticum]KAB1070468.1 oligosaccharide flippase family protein [Methylobacterium planeticum]
MIARHTFLYVGARGLAAALNMASVAVFTRLAPVETYGAYLLVLSWALVLYGATCQWPKFSFFALYDEARAPAQVGTVARLLAAMLVLAGAAALLAALFGLASPRTAAILVAAVLGMTLFEAASEIARARLEAGPVALAIVVRAVLILGLGSFALAATGDPADLVLAVAAANVLAALPALRAILPILRGGASRLEARRLVAYGWPLVLSFGIAALAQTSDRLIIGRMVGPEELGAYGAIADFLRQSFVVFGESVALSLISIAKRDARAGGMAAAESALGDAARALTLVAAFGAVFVLGFDDLIVAILLGPGYRAQALTLAPVLLVASIFLMFRSYYFGQVIYFTRTSHLDAVASLVLLVAVAGLSVLLIPRMGVMGAALAFAVGQGLACLVFVLGARLAPAGERVRMPVPGADLLGIVLVALACGTLLYGIGQVPGGRSAAGQAARLGLLAAGFLLAAWHFNVVGIADALRRRRAA